MVASVQQSAFNAGPLAAMAVGVNPDVAVFGSLPPSDEVLQCFNIQAATLTTCKRAVPADEDKDLLGKKSRSVLHDISNGKLVAAASEVADEAQEQRTECGAAGPLDIDVAHRDDPQACTSYVCDIYQNLRIAECKRRPSTCYMEQVQRDINASMRAILVDWLVEVGEEYKLVPETLHLTVSYIDRYLSVTPVLRSKLQLVGVASMLIASKYEEIYPPNLDEFCYVTDHTYQKEELLRCERDILQTLNFELTVPTVRSFIRRYLRAAQADSKTEFLAMYLGELSLLEYSMLVFVPSQIAAASVMLALVTLGRPIWSPTLQHYAGYTPKELQNCVRALHKCFCNAHKSQMSAIREKYAMHSFKCVSNIAPSHSSLPEHLFL